MPLLYTVSSVPLRPINCGEKIPDIVIHVLMKR